MTRRLPVIAIDGPAGAGKSTVARAVAERLGVGHLDTGAMYRSVAYAALAAGVDPADAAAVAALARRLSIEVGPPTLVDGVDATVAIRTPEVNVAVSEVARNAEVRRELVRRQREWAEAHGGGVLEGRDIGTVVCPDAELKVYLTASQEERARRRTEEAAPGLDAAADVARRDRADSTRAASPLAVADDAVVIDTTGRPVAAVVDAVLALL